MVVGRFYRAKNNRKRAFYKDFPFNIAWSKPDQNRRAALLIRAYLG
jgi:hypothetical protein